jgi:uncharacterized membrane protein
VVLGTYGIAGGLADPRLISAVAWLAVVGWLGWVAWKEETGADTNYAMFLLVAGVSVWPVVLFGSWTEPLSVALFVLAAILWRRRPVPSAVLLGLAIASKQYFIFLAPLLVVHRDESKWMRLGMASALGLLTILIGLVPDPSAYVTATITNLSEIGFRPDTQSLPGLLASYGIEFFLGPIAWIGVGLIMTSIVARGSETPSEFLARAALALGLAFFIGSAFINYWFLVLAVAAVATALGAVTGDPGGVDEAGSVSAGRG